MRAHLPNHRARRRGLTLVELSIGMVITAMVMGALGGMWFAVADAWRQSSSSQNAGATATQATARLDALLRDVRHVGVWTAGSINGSAAGASVLVWRGDAWARNENGTAKTTLPDWIPQLGELLLIEHDPAAGKVYYYEPIPLASMTGTQPTRASKDVTWAELNSATLAASFKASDLVKRKVLTEGCAGAVFNVHAANGSTRACVEYSLRIVRPGAASLVYGTTTFRCPSPRPS